MSHNQQTGKKGETIAVTFLKQKGYSIIDTNWSSRFGELDIIAKHNNTFVFIEVKTRHSTNTETAFASITPSKREKMIRTIYQYLHEHDIDDDMLWQIDAIGVALRRNQSPVIDHVENAFDW